MNMMTATECLLEMCDEHFEHEDYQGGVPRWCTGCGDTAILAAVQRLCRDEGLRPEKTMFVSGIGEVMRRFRKVMTVENNWSDDPQLPIIDEGNRRFSALAMLLRARYLVDVDCWTEVRARPIRPGSVRDAILARMDA